METFSDDLDYQSLLQGYAKNQQVSKIFQIGSFMSKVPGEKVLQEKCKTDDLKFFWYYLRCFYQNIARCFIVISLKDIVGDCHLSLNDVFNESLNRKSIKRRDIEIYALEANRLLREWQLFEVGFSHLIAEIPHFQFQEDKPRLT